MRGMKNEEREEVPEFVKTQRHLPHWRKEGVVYWITYRLADSIPYGELREWQGEREIWIASHPEPWGAAEWHEYETLFGERLDAWLDAGIGSCALAKPEVREVVRESLMYFDGERLWLHAAVIMPTHVHCLIELFEGFELSRVLKSVKGVSARRANLLLGKSGQFWMEESYDHVVRSEAQYWHFVKYIRANPVKAGLAADAYWLYVAHDG